MTVIKVESGRDGIKGEIKMVESVKENTRGGERIFLSLVKFCHDLFYICTFPLYPLAPVLAIG